MPLFCHFLRSVELTSTIFVFVREDEETNSIIVYKSNNNPKSVKILVIKIKSSVLVGQIKRWLRSHPPMHAGRAQWPIIIWSGGKNSISVVFLLIGRLYTTSTMWKFTVEFLLDYSQFQLGQSPKLGFRGN